MLIRFELKKIGIDRISFKVLEQSNKLFRINENFTFGKQTFYIRSVGQPYLSLKTHFAIWIRGTATDGDNWECFEKFNNEFERDSHYELILILFKLLNKRFKDED
jgi:hypothetical protein